MIMTLINNVENIFVFKQLQIVTSVLVGGIDHIRQHTYRLAKRAYDELRTNRHRNGQPIAIIYCQQTSNDEYPSIDEQGAIVNFNLLRDDGSYIGYVEVSEKEDNRDKVSDRVLRLRKCAIYSVSSCVRDAFAIWVHANDIYISMILHSYRTINR